jgi:hypothetical protein
MTDSDAKTKTGPSNTEFEITGIRPEAENVGLSWILKEKCLGRQRWPSERVGSVLIPTMGLNRLEILLEPIRKVPSPPWQCTQSHFVQEQLPTTNLRIRSRIRIHPSW